MYEIIVEETFEAAHFLGGPGEVRRMHGHTWKVVVSLCATQLGKAQIAGGMPFVADFGVVKAWLRDLGLDHTCLNDFLPVTPTCENLARWIYEQLDKQLIASADSQRPILNWVEVWQSERNRARYFVTVPAPSKYPKSAPFDDLRHATQDDILADQEHD